MFFEELNFILTEISHYTYLFLLPRYPVTPLRPPAAGQVSGQAATQTTYAKFSAPPPPTGPPPPDRSAPPRTSKDRGALLSDIRRGTKLKETVTDDRSAPRI